MRIVELQQDTTSGTYRMLRGVGITAAVFSIVMAILLIANQVSLNRLDPVHSPAVQKLLEQLKSRPQDQALREEIRELDLLARRAFFTSQHFNRISTLLLLGGLAVMVVSFKTLHAYRPSRPYPDVGDPRDDRVADARWARQSVTAIGLLLAGFALALALPWRSPLDAPDVGVATDQHPPVPASATAVASAPGGLRAGPFPSREELQRHWPGFLGANDGRTAATNAPVAWDAGAGSGVGWKIEVPLPGFNSPVVWGNRVFLTGATAKERTLYAFDALTGVKVWEHQAGSVPGSPASPPEVIDDTGHAAPTVATDGRGVFAIFSNGDAVALEVDGAPRWKRHLGVPENPYGYASSPLIFEDVLVIQFDRKNGSFITGLDTATGATRWVTLREVDPSWASPRLVWTEGGPEILTSGSPRVAAYDPRSGKELWHVDCFKNADVGTSPVYAAGLVYAAAEGLGLVAIDEATRTILWRRETDAPGVGTPLVVNGLLIYGGAEGGIFCLDARTGAERWHERTDEIFYASPILVGDRVYLADRGGTVHIFAAEGGGFRSLGRPVLGESTVTTPAATEAGLFFRGTKHLMRVNR